MREIGFWDYTCPDHGSLEQYSKEDWDLLLDDMAAGGFNSLVLCVKWLTTGYRSKYTWLDQRADDCSAIASDNEIIHYALEGARRRGIRTWLLVVGSIFEMASFGIEPANPASNWGNVFGLYDIDQPGIADRAVELFTEVAELFGQSADGIIAELEFCDGEGQHRIPIYNSWAQANERPDFATIKNIPLEPRSFPFEHWRDFTTDRRIVLLQRIETAVRATGFSGEMATLAELVSEETVVAGNMNLVRLRAALPQWKLVTYDSVYDRRVNRLATMDFCIERPHQLGFEVCWLTRGVMTFGASWSEKVDSLREQWQMSIEDAVRFKPEVLWFMGSDARLEGKVCNRVLLPKWGFPEGRAARCTLMQMVDAAGLHEKV
jgi:hypothetical protein